MEVLKKYVGVSVTKNLDDVENALHCRNPRCGCVFTARTRECNDKSFRDTWPPVLVFTCPECGLDVYSQ